MILSPRSPIRLLLVEWFKPVLHIMFLDPVNSLNTSIKFMYEVERRKINFLYVTVQPIK